MSVKPVVTCPSCGTQNRVAAAAPGAPHCARCQAALPWLVDATDENFSGVVAGASLPVLLDLWAPWCPPCRIIAPTVEKSAERFAGRLKVAKLNVDESPATSQRFGVQGIPTLLILRDGREVARQVGALVGEPFFAWVESALAQVAT